MRLPLERSWQASSRGEGARAATFDPAWHNSQPWTKTGPVLSSYPRRMVGLGELPGQVGSTGDMAPMMLETLVEFMGGLARGTLVASPVGARFVRSRPAGGLGLRACVASVPRGGP